MPTGVHSHDMITWALTNLSMVSAKLRLADSMDQHVINIQLTDAVARTLLAILR